VDSPENLYIADCPYGNSKRVLTSLQIFKHTYYLTAKEAQERCIELQSERVAELTRKLESEKKKLANLIQRCSIVENDI